MKRRNYFFALLSVLMLVNWLSACGIADISERSVLKLSTSSSLITYDCSYFTEFPYDTLADCNNTTLANCIGEWKTFPNGGVSQCYGMVEGGDICLTLSPAADWEYTAYEQFGSAMADPYNLVRSLIGCSSDICACLNPVETTLTIAKPADCPSSTCDYITH